MDPNVVYWPIHQFVPYDEEPIGPGARFRAMAASWALCRTGRWHTTPQPKLPRSNQVPLGKQLSFSTLAKTLTHATDTMVPTGIARAKHHSSTGFWKRVHTPRGLDNPILIYKVRRPSVSTALKLDHRPETARPRTDRQNVPTQT